MEDTTNHPPPAAFEQADTSRNDPSGIRLNPPPEEEVDDLTQIVTQKHISQMQRDMAIRKLKRAKKGFFNFVRGFDLFGKPISLNFQGDESFKTLGGSFLSILMVWLVFTSVVSNVHDLSHDRTWSEYTKMEILDWRELDRGISFGEFPGFKAGFEFRPISSIASQREYLEKAELMAELLAVHERGQVKNLSGVLLAEAALPSTEFDFGSLAIPLIRTTNLAPDNLADAINSQGYLEFPIDLNGTRISGSDTAMANSSISSQSFYLALDQNSLARQILKECKGSDACSAMLRSDGQIFNWLAQIVNCDGSKNEGQKEAYEQFLRQALSDERQKYLFAQKFYTTFEAAVLPSSDEVPSCDLVRQKNGNGHHSCDFQNQRLGSKCFFEHYSNELMSRFNEARPHFEIIPVVYGQEKHIREEEENDEDTSPFQSRKSSRSPPIAADLLKAGADLVEVYSVTLRKSRICSNSELGDEQELSWEEFLCPRGYQGYEGLGLAEDYASYQRSSSQEASPVLTLSMDSRSELTVVRYSGMYDLISQNGGYLYGLFIVFSLAGRALSSIQFSFSVAQESYYTRDKKEELHKRYKTSSIKEGILRIDNSFDCAKIKELFPKIRFTSSFYVAQACCKCFIGKPCKSLKEQKRILKRANERFSEEMDVLKLLKKIRLSTDIWTQLLSKNQKKALRFSKSNVVVQNDKKRNRIVQKTGSVFEKVDDPPTSSSGINFEISHSSSMTSEYREEVRSEPDAKIERAHSFFQIPVVNMLPLPKPPKVPEPLPPKAARKKKRDTETSPNSSVLRSNLSKYEQLSPMLRKKKGHLEKRNMSSSSEKKQVQQDIVISDLNMTLGDIQFQSVKLTKNHSDMNAVRQFQQKHALEMEGEIESESKKHRHRSRHRDSHHRHKKRSSQFQNEAGSIKDADYSERRLVKKKDIDEADLSQVTPQDSKGRLQPFGADAPTPLASERVPDHSSAELRVRKHKKKKKKRDSSRSESRSRNENRDEPKDLGRDMGQPPFNSETINAEE